MAQRVYKLDENLVCRCGHKWREHKHVQVTNREYLSYPLTINGFMAFECEHKRAIGFLAPKDEPEYCECNSFKPAARNVQRVLEVWVKDNDRR